jgi:hypothetical protein
MHIKMCRELVARGSDLLSLADLNVQEKELIWQDRVYLRDTHGSECLPKLYIAVNWASRETVRKYVYTNVY